MIGPPIKAAATISKNEVFKKDDEYFPLFTTKKATITSLTASKLRPADVTLETKYVFRKSKNSFKSFILSLSIIAERPQEDGR